MNDESIPSAGRIPPGRSLADSKSLRRDDGETEAEFFGRILEIKRNEATAAAALARIRQKLEELASALKHSDAHEIKSELLEMISNAIEAAR